MSNGMIIGLVIAALAVCGGGTAYFLLSSEKTAPVASVQEKNQILRRLIAKQSLLSCQRSVLLLELELWPLLLLVSNQMLHLKVCNSAVERLSQNQTVILI
jgi:hypothetical protein